MREKSTIPQYIPEDGLTISRQPVAFSRTIFSLFSHSQDLYLRTKRWKLQIPINQLCPGKTHLSLITNIGLNYKKGIDEMIIDANVFS